MGNENALTIEKIQISNPHTLIPLKSEIKATIEIKQDSDNILFAWYVYLNDQLVDKKTYSQSHQTCTFKFDKPGKYRLKGYAKDDTGAKSSIYSHEISVYPQRKYIKSKQTSGYDTNKVNYSDINTLDIKEKKATIYSIQKNSQIFDFLIKRDFNSSTLVVLGSGAYNPDKSQLPNFQRHSWMNEINGNVIYYNDPTLYLKKINIGWGQGTENEFYLETIADILMKLADKMNINKENILFYGSSAGGFMSLILGGYVKGASVLVNNPQTIVPNYFKVPVSDMYSASYANTSRENIEEKFKERLDIREFYTQIEFIPNIFYLQNAACESDMTQHYKPFNKFYDSKRNVLKTKNFISHLYWDDVAQHNPLDKKTTLYYINKVNEMWIQK